MDDGTHSTQAVDSTDLFLLTAHDVSTSLTAVRWAIELLQQGDRGPLTEDQHQLLAQIKKQNERSITLLHSAITAIKASDLQLVYTMKPIQVEHILVESIEAFTIEAAKKDMRFLYHPESKSSKIIADEQKISIVFHTLIKNAIRYGTPGTDITITVEHVDDTVSVEVKNKGIGIPLSQQEHIFKRFFRGANTTEHADGFGLGLYAAKKIVEGYRGTISFTSSEGEGASFIVTFPLTHSTEQGYLV
jgi:signal transduction histidine kinase